MKVEGDSTGPVLLKLCRLVLLAGLLIWSMAILRYESITIQVHATVLKVTDDTDSPKSSSLRSEQPLGDQHGRDGSISEVASALTASNDEIEIAGKQIDSDSSQRPPIEVTKARAVDAERTQLNNAKAHDVLIPEVESALAATYNGSEIAVERIQTDEIERLATVVVNESAAPVDGMHLDGTNPEVTAKPETTRFVLFLCDLSFFNGAVALLASLAESRSSTTLPPLVMIMEDVPFKPYAQEMLEALGAQVKVVDQPQELANAMKLRGSKVKKRWGVFSKMHLFRRDIVDCDVVFYIDVDAVVRGNVIDCMDDILQSFRSKPELDILAVGKRQYFNNGVMLARPRDSTFSYLVEMLRNGTCVGNCTDSDYTTMMRRRIDTDQDVFIEYTQRFPNRFEPIDKASPLNVRPMHRRFDVHANCSVIHYVGEPKPWVAWFALPNISTPVDGTSLPMLREHFPESLKALIERQKEKGTPWTTPVWSLEVWRDYWNQAVTGLPGRSVTSSLPLDVVVKSAR